MDMVGANGTHLMSRNKQRINMGKGQRGGLRKAEGLKRKGR